MKKQRYPLTDKAELLSAYACATDPRFFEVLGFAIDAERLRDPGAALLVSAAQEINRTTSSPCLSTVAAIQFLRMRVNAGKMTLEDLDKASDVCDTVEDIGGITDLEGLIQSVAPAIKSVASLTALDETIAAAGTKLDPGEAADRFTAVAALGQGRVSSGIELMWSEDQIEAAAKTTITDPLPTGITDLDVALGGGTERSSLGVFLGNSGDGKSLALCHVAAESIWDGRKVAYVSAELSELQIAQRVICNVVNMTATELANNPKEASRRRGMLTGLFGPAYDVGEFRCLYVTPKVGTVASIKQWLRTLEQKGFMPDVLLVDYADKLAARAQGEAKGSYLEQGAIYQQLRDLIVERGIWGWTASQTTGRQGRKKKLDIEDIADSMEKARICDTLVAIVRHEEDVDAGLVRFRLPKRRNGQAHMEVGPMTMDPEHGRMVTVSRAEPW